MCNLLWYVHCDEVQLWAREYYWLRINNSQVLFLWVWINIEIPGCSLLTAQCSLPWCFDVAGRSTAPARCWRLSNARKYKAIVADIRYILLTYLLTSYCAFLQTTLLNVPPLWKSNPLSPSLGERVSIVQRCLAQLIFFE